MEQKLSQNGWKMIKNSSQNDVGVTVHDIDFSYHTRTDDPCSVIPDKFYSSLKYQVKVSFTCSCKEPLDMVMCHAQVVDEDGEEVIKNGETILAGKSSLALQPNPTTKTSKNVKKIQLKRNSSSFNSSSVNQLGGDASGQVLPKLLTTTTKMQITDVSYHHSKKSFCLQLSFAAPLNNFASPIVILRSRPFQVYARRNNYKPKKENKVALAAPVCAPASSSPLLSESSVFHMMNTPAPITLSKRVRSSQADDEQAVNKRIKLSSPLTDHHTITHDTNNDSWLMNSGNEHSIDHIMLGNHQLSLDQYMKALVDFSKTIQLNDNHHDVPLASTFEQDCLDFSDDLPASSIPHSSHEYYTSTSDEASLKKYMIGEDHQQSSEDYQSMVPKGTCYFEDFFSDDFTNHYTNNDTAIVFHEEPTVESSQSEEEEDEIDILSNNNNMDKNDSLFCHTPSHSHYLLAQDLW